MRINISFAKLFVPLSILSKQGIPLQGDNEEVNHYKNPGKLLALLKNYAQTDEVLFNCC